MTNYKVLLIHPKKAGTSLVQDSMKYPPLGIATLASVLREKGITPFIFDANVEKPNHSERISKIVEKQQIDAVGISFTTFLAGAAYDLADMLKITFPKLPIIAGGYHPTVMSEEVMAHSSIDFAVIGEGEITFPLLLACLQADSSPETVAGLCFRSHGKIVHTHKRPLLTKLDDVPIPAYELLRLDGYTSLTSTRKPFVTFIRSRGCFFNCLFCGVSALFSHRYRCQSPERTVKDTLYLSKTLKIREIQFKDSEFLLDRRNVEEFCRLLIKEHLDLVWSCSARVDKVDRDILELMKRAGCKRITYGIESGSERMLGVLRKHFTINQVVEAVKCTKDLGLECVAGFIIGTPGEDWTTINQTINLLKSLRLDYASFQFLTAFPGSDLYAEAVQNKWFLTTEHNRGYEEPNINATNLTDIELKKAMRMMIRSFYFTPSFILSRFRKMTIRQLRNSIVGAFALVAKLVKSSK